MDADAERDKLMDSLAVEALKRLGRPSPFRHVEASVILLDGGYDASTSDVQYALLRLQRSGVVTWSHANCLYALPEWSNQ